MAKILPLIEKLKTNCQRFGVFHKNLSTDASIVPCPCQGLHSAKHFVKGKPGKFGFKLWMLGGVDGLPYNMNIYYEKDSKNQPIRNKYCNYQSLSSN